MSNQMNRIWQPNIKPTNVGLTYPGSLNRQSAQLYTKTSLLPSQAVSSRSINREILNACQSYNNSPKPFARPCSQSTASQSMCSPSTPQDQRQQVGSISQKTPNVLVPSEASNVDRVQVENMVPKLIHKQYNSPIDLYSMNNIRKTIEAHTEFIAPGLKGINFMKSETPVNKDSEVYKLVMEEEQRQRRDNQLKSAIQSPISAQPTILVSSAVNTPTKAPHQRLTVPPPTNLSMSRGNVQRDSPKEECDTSGPIGVLDKKPTCAECGQFIVGPFAKIQDRLLHPQCFNCTTCGTSLKNTGYFTVSDKLYCDIHAKQVASVMNINYNFDYVNRELKSKLTSQFQQQPHQQQSSLSQAQEQSFSTDTINGVSKSIAHNNSSSANTSTVFAERDNIETTKEEKRGVKWAWRPVTSKDRLSLPSSSEIEFTSTSRRKEDNTHQSSAPNLQQPQKFIENHSPVSDRIPVCYHCQVQIQGPYILAGKKTWCKLCSQANFKCSSCQRSLLDIGFIEDKLQRQYCEYCYETFCTPVCSKCNMRIKGDCLNALEKQWHPSCFVCGHCHKPFGNSAFYLEDNLPYCERDWKLLFTTKCYSCSYPIEAGDKWIEALERNYHLTCFKCTFCQSNLEGSTFYCKGGKPYCGLHAKQ